MQHFRVFSLFNVFLERLIYLFLQRPRSMVNVVHNTLGINKLKYITQI